MRVVVGNVAYCTVCRCHMELQDFMENREAMYLFFHPPGADCPNANRRFKALTVELEEVLKEGEMGKVNPKATMEEVGVNVCGANGHFITVLENDVVQPKFRVLCYRCGMTLKEIRGEKE